MSATAILGTSQRAKPVCLFENPYRLVSLWDIVIEFSGATLFMCGVGLEETSHAAMWDAGLGQMPFQVSILHQPVNDKTAQRAVEWVSSVVRICDRLGAPISASTARDIVGRLEGNEKPSFNWLKHQMGSLKELIRKELREKLFVYISPEKLRFVSNDERGISFGQAVVDSFPSTRFDICEAGVCLAASRATAAVFHLMRVLEIGLSAFAGKFDIPSDHTNWHNIIEGIEKAVRSMGSNPNRAADWKDQQEFFSQAASHFMSFKDAWRNYTAHSRGVFTEERAALIFDSVRSFMQTLAAQLHEPA